MRKMFFQRRALSGAIAALAACSLVAACGGGDDATATADAEDAALKFDASSYTTVNVTVDGQVMAVRQYRVVYVAKPIKMASTLTTFNTSTLSDRYAMQTMIVSVPESKIADQKTALYFSVNNGGWFASPVSASVTEGKAFVSTSDTDNVGAALKAGYVVIDVGTRSRGARAEDGSWVGKAPAPVVDAKAAIRYLRLNDGLMPGSAERIVVNGTSGGGGLTAAVAASGNSTDYLSYLDEIGAAGVSGSGASLKSTIKDDVFAAVAYCPINNLGNADAGYEWQYGAIRTDANTPALNGSAYSAGLQPAASTAIAAAFPTYFNALGLKRADGTALTDANLNGLLEAELKAEVERQIAKGTAVPAFGGSFVLSSRNPFTGAVTTTTLANDWLTLTGSGTSATVASIDVTKFLTFVAANSTLKSVVAFDAVGVTDNKNASTGAWNISGESTLFGSEAYQYSNFTEWSWTNNQVLGDGSGADDYGVSWSQYLANSSNTLAQQIKLINPVPYLSAGAATNPAPYWYVRHGMIDRDTAFSMQLLLARAIAGNAAVKDLSFKLPYLTPHSGNYDVQEAFTWIQAKLAANP